MEYIYFEHLLTVSILKQTVMHCKITGKWFNLKNDDMYIYIRYRYISKHLLCVKKRTVTGYKWGQNQICLCTELWQQCTVSAQHINVINNTDFMTLCNEPHTSSKTCWTDTNQCTQAGQTRCDVGLPWKQTQW